MYFFVTVNYLGHFDVPRQRLTNKFLAFFFRELITLWSKFVTRYSMYRSDWCLSINSFYCYFYDKKLYSIISLQVWFTERANRVVFDKNHPLTSVRLTCIDYLGTFPFIFLNHDWARILLDFFYAEFY